jgi:hypothetical protein
VDKNTESNVVSLSKRAAANRLNAQLSTGPRTEKGKNWSRRNGLKHGILASALLVTGGGGAEDHAEFDRLLNGLYTDLVPIGTLEVMLVETIAICYWREGRALRCEAGQILENGSDYMLYNGGHLAQSILRYETTIQRQLAYTLNQLERLQRARKGEHVPAPVNVQVSTDQ